MVVNERGLLEPRGDGVVRLLPQPDVYQDKWRQATLRPLQIEPACGMVLAP